MKQKRQEAILELIEEEMMETQEELLLALERRGFACTQATISRDIRELALTKRMVAGRSCYVSPLKLTLRSGASLLAGGIESVVAVEFIVVVKTKPGLAMAVCTALDQMLIEGNAGNIAGDDTCMMMMSHKKKAQAVARDLQENLL